MHDEEFERLVTQILQRLRPPTLVVVTAAAGYRSVICERLASWGQPLHMALAEDIPDRERWLNLGELLPAKWEPANYRALVVPFLNYSLAAGLVNGTLQHPAVECIQKALLADLPVLALRYHCDPYSELNQLRGAADCSAYAEQIQATLAKLTDCGVTFCTMNTLLQKLSAKPSAPMPARRRYLTVADVISNPTLASAPSARLTDAAIDFLKYKK